MAKKILTLSFFRLFYYLEIRETKLFSSFMGRINDRIAATNGIRAKA